MKKKSLGRRIRLAMILLVAVTLLVAGIIFFFTMKNTMEILASSNDDLNYTIRKESSSITAEQSQIRLLEMAENKAAIADEIFSEFEQGVTIAASVAEDIYDHPEQFTARPAPLPDAKNDGKLSLQVLYSAKTDPDDPAIVEELGLLGNVGEVLMAVNESQDNMASLYVATESGFMVQADYISAKKFDDKGNLMPLEAKERPWYKGAAETGKRYFTPVTMDAHTPRLGIMCGVPVYSGGKLKGVAGAGMYLDGMQDLVRSVNLGENGNACIINEKGQVLFSTFDMGTLTASVNGEDLRLSRDVMLSEMVTDAVKGETGVMKIKVDRVPTYVAFAPMKTIGWAMVVFLSEEAVESPTEELLDSIDDITDQTFLDTQSHVARAGYLLLVLLGIALIVAIVISFVLSRRIVKPIVLLTDKVGAMEGENLEFSWDMDTGDETSTLASSFQSLTLRMKEYIRDMATMTAENERISTELSLASRIQSDMLPSVFPPFPERKDIDIYASMDAAREVGGDFYDFFLIDDDHLCMVMADVSGKGVPAALFMMVSMITLADNAKSGKSPAEILRDTNAAICTSNKEEMFVTVWLGILDLKTGLLTAANAGHEYPVFQEPGGDFRLFKDKHGFVIGGMPGLRYTEYTVRMQPGSKLFLYTDGVPEATDKDHQMFGLDRMLDSLNADTEADPETVLRNVRRAVDEFVGGAEQFDDLTMLCITYNGPDSLPDSEEKDKAEEI